MSFHFQTPGTPGIGAYLGQALGGGVTSLADQLSKGLEKKAKEKQLQDILNPPKDQGERRDYDLAEDESVRENFLNIISQAEQQYEQDTGETFSPEQIDAAWNQYVGKGPQGQPDAPPQAPKAPARREYTVTQLGALADDYPKLATFLQQEQAEEAKKEAAEKKYEQQKDLVYEKAYAGANMKFLEDVKKEDKEGKLQDLALEGMENALQGNTSWSAFLDLMADATHYEPFRTAQGAELATAMKQYLFKDISSVPASAVRNQWIERQIFNSYPRLGRDPISNAKVVLGFQYAKNLRNKKTEVTRRLEGKYLDSGKNLPRGFENEVNRELSPYYVQQSKETKQKMQRLNKVEGDTVRALRKELGKNEVLMIDKTGQPQAVRRDQIDEAKEQGFLIFG